MNQTETEFPTSDVGSTTLDGAAGMKERVNQSLLKLGYSRATFVAEDAGTVTIHSPDWDRNDQCIMQVALRLLPGVTSVDFAATPRAR